MKQTFVVGLILMMATAAHAKTVSVTMNKIDDKGEGPMIGLLQLEDTKGGLQITPSLNGLPPGQHGIHVHEKSDCGGRGQGQADRGNAAGGHLDPKHSGSISGPTVPKDTRAICRSWWSTTRERREHQSSRRI